jgi:hypothetical protein
MDEAKQRARTFLDGIIIEGTNAKGESILTNISYLRENLDRLLTF